MATSTKTPQPNPPQGVGSPLQDPRISGGFPFRFSSPGAAAGGQPPPALQQQQHPLSQFMGQQQPPTQPHHMANYGSRFPFMQQPSPSSQLSTNTAGCLTSATPTGHLPPSHGQDKNWQDGLRALLPNINISFASKFIFVL